MHRIILNKTTIVMRTKEVRTINLDWMYFEFDEALQKYNEMIIDEAKHCGSIGSDAVRLAYDIQFVTTEDNIDTIHYRLQLSN